MAQVEQMRGEVHQASQTAANFPTNEPPKIELLEHQVTKLFGDVQRAFDMLYLLQGGVAQDFEELKGTMKANQEKLARQVGDLQQATQETFGIFHGEMVKVEKGYKGSL